MHDINEKSVEPAQKAWTDPECVAVEISEVTQAVPVPGVVDAGVFIS